jgi:hypothetical protein
MMSTVNKRANLSPLFGAMALEALFQKCRARGLGDDREVFVLALQKMAVEEMENNGARRRPSRQKNGWGWPSVRSARG